MAHRPNYSQLDSIIFTPFSCLWKTRKLLLILPAIHSHSFSPMFFQRRGHTAHSRYSNDLDSQNESSGREDENDYDSSCGSLYGEPVEQKRRDRFLQYPAYDRRLAPFPLLIIMQFSFYAVFAPRYYRRLSYHCWFSGAECGKAVMTVAYGRWATAATRPQSLY